MALFNPSIFMTLIGINITWKQDASMALYVDELSCLLTLLCHAGFSESLLQINVWCHTVQWNSGSTCLLPLATGPQTVEILYSVKCLNCSIYNKIPQKYWSLILPVYRIILPSHMANESEYCCLLTILCIHASCNPATEKAFGSDMLPWCFCSEPFGCCKPPSIMLFMQTQPTEVPTEHVTFDGHLQLGLQWDQGWVY